VRIHIYSAGGLLNTDYSEPENVMQLIQMKTSKLFVVAAVSGFFLGCVCPGSGLPFPSCGLGQSRSMAVPDVIPLGAISRAHWHTMETNGEASDFVMYRNEFVDGSTEFSPYGRDHIMEIAARMPSTPFPVIVQRSDNNADPELDAARRQLVVQVLTDMGAQDAEQRTIVSQPYNDGINSLEAEQDYARFRLSRNRGGNGGSGSGF